MNDRVLGIILKQSDYKDSSVILKVLTKTYGKISFVVQGAKKISGKRNHLQPYCIAEFLLDYKEDKDMFRMKNAAVKFTPRNIYSDLVKSSAASVLCEVTDDITVTKDLSAETEMFNDLQTAIRFIDDGKDPDLVLSVYVSDLLNFIGMSPAVDGCAICGSTVVSAKSAREGGFLCSEHARLLGVVNVSKESLHQFRLICKANTSQIPLIEAAVQDAEDDLKELIDFYRIHAGLKIRSYDLYVRMKQV